MPRAITPASPLGSIRLVPKPKFKIGQKVLLDYLHPSDKHFYARIYLKHLLREDRKIHNRLLRQELTKGYKLPGGIKDNIRECIKRLWEATEVEIVGIVPWSMYNIDDVQSNECYIGGVPGASSPMRYEYHILIRFKNDNGNNIALVTGCPIGCDNSFKPLSQ